MTALLPIERECDCKGCTNTFTPIGDGTTPFRSTETGGKYFCSNACREKYVPEVNVITLLAQAFTKAGLPSPDVAAGRFIEAFQPKVRELEPSGDTRRFAVTIAPEVSLISCIIGGDSNLSRHTGREGTTQTLVRIADFACIVNLLHPKGKLVEIKNVRLTQPVPLGATVVISMKHQLARHGVIKYEVSATLQESDQAICRPTTVTVTV